MLSASVSASHAGPHAVGAGKPSSHAAGPAQGDAAALLSALRAVPCLREVGDAQLAALVASGLAALHELTRDTLLDAALPADALCVVVTGQVAVGVFTAAGLLERGQRQRDAACGEQDGTLMPPGPLARAAKQNLALFGPGDLLNLGALAATDGGGALGGEGGPTGDDEVVRAFSLGRASLLSLRGDALAYLARAVPAVARALTSELALGAARLRNITGVKREILDFYVRHGLSVSGPSVRLRQLDLCIDCKQCEEACTERHGAQRLTLGGFELGLLDFVFTCRTCADARCLSPCEHDAIKRDAKTGEIQIHEDRCIGCSLCALSCPYGAIQMINVAEPELPSYSPTVKARLERGDKLAFGPGKGRKAPARRIADKCDHCAGYAEQACVSACPTGALIELAPAALFRERPAPAADGKPPLEVLPTRPFLEGIAVRDSGSARVRARRLSALLWLLGLGAFAAVLAEVVLRAWAPRWSLSYRAYVREGLEPALAEMNVSYLAGSKLALGCGYVGTALMLLSMSYVLQRRFGWFHKTATNSFWLDVHLMTGIVGPLFILLHSALRLSTWVSVPFWSMVAVVGSGALGRYLYTLIPSLTNRHELQILEDRRAIAELAVEYPEAAELAYQRLGAEGERSAQSWEIGLVTLLLWVMFDDVRRMWTRARDRRALRRVAPRKVARRIARRMDRVVFFERRRELAPRSKALLKAWKRVHVPFSVVLAVTMTVHIAIALWP